MIFRHVHVSTACTGLWIYVNKFFNISNYEWWSLPSLYNIIIIERGYISLLTCICWRIYWQKFRDLWCNLVLLSFCRIAYHNFMRSPCDSIVIHVQVHIYPHTIVHNIHVCIHVALGKHVINNRHLQHYLGSFMLGQT